MFEGAVAREVVSCVCRKPVIPTYIYIYIYIAKITLLYVIDFVEPCPESYLMDTNNDTNKIYILYKNIIYTLTYIYIYRGHTTLHAHIGVFVYAAHIYGRVDPEFRIPNSEFRM